MTKIFLNDIADESPAFQNAWHSFGNSIWTKYDLYNSGRHREYATILLNELAETYHSKIDDKDGRPYFADEVDLVRFILDWL